MLNFKRIADQLEADGHYDISNAVRAHGNCASDLKAALDFSDNGQITSIFISQWLAETKGLV